MLFSCLYHRWSAGRNAGELDCESESFKKLAECCPRCAAYSQRLRSMDAKLRKPSVEEEFPEGLHSKIMGAVREVQISDIEVNQSRKGKFGLFALSTCGVAALVAFLLFTSAGGTPIGDPIGKPEVAEKPNPEVPVQPEVETTPEEDPNPTATRLAKFTGELPEFIADKVSKPYQSEIDLLTDDLSAAGEFLQDALFVSHVREGAGL